MRFLLLAIPVALASPGPCAAVERILQEWDFTKAADTLGWKAAEPLDEFRVADGALTGRATGAYRPKLESPIFDIRAGPWQCVEVELKTDAQGSGQVYFSNTTEEPYHGFRPQLHTTFEIVKAGGFRTCRVLPFWQRQGRITHIRIDPPGSIFAIRAVRIIEIGSDQESKSTDWRFKGTRAGWTAVGTTGGPGPTSRGWEITGSGSDTVLSPPINIDSDDCLYATVRIASKTSHTALLRWAARNLDGQQTCPIELKSDGIVHTYLIDLADQREWTGPILGIGFSPTESAEPRTVLLESITLADAPVGPPELEIARFTLENPFVRVGQKARLTCEVRNIGGTEARSVAALITVEHRSAHECPPARRIAALAPGATARFECEITATKAGEQLAVCRVNGIGLDAGQKTIHLHFHPRLDTARTKPTGYVPEPQPASTGDYLIGCYYFPGWHTYERWAVLDDFPERRPILGYYREGSPEVADWQIKWALDHGIGFFIYDWYWSDGARQLEHGLHDGFLNSRYQEKMQFCLLWANHNPPSKAPEADLANVTRYWIENYFRRPNYLKIDGKNVMVIFSPHRLSEDLGAAGVKSAFEKMRRMCEEAGVGGLYLIACTYPDNAAIKQLVDEGYDALSGYNYPTANNKGQQRAPYEWMVEGYNDYWQRISDASSIPYIPVCEPGWDARPWHGSKSLVRTGKSPAPWRKMLANAKAFADDPSRKHPPGRKIIFLEAWNEFGEGDYVEPHAEFGFGYLEAIRSVFAPTSKAPVIVVPPDVGMGPYELTQPGPQTAWDFSKREDRTWTIGNMTDFNFDGGVMRAAAQTDDPAFCSPVTRIDAARFGSVEIKMKLDQGTEAQLFFAGPNGVMDEEKSVRFSVVPDGQFHAYKVSFSNNARWRGVIGRLRLDPTASAGARIEVAHVRLVPAGS